MKLILMITFLVVYVNAVENNKNGRTLGTAYPMELEIEAYEVIKDTLCNPQDSLNVFKKAYSKPLLRTDFEFLRVMDEVDSKENFKF